MKTSILLITFNRPNHTRRVLEAILASGVHDFYVFQDAPRDNHPDDIMKCRAVREMIETYVDGRNLHLHTFYAKQNMGCGPGPAAAITWFFEHVEMGIIIEDDAIPAPEFFSYATELLERYKEDSSVRAIGSMKIFPQTYGDGSYYFSMMNRNLCAWATWRRAWNDFDLYMKNVSRKEFNKAMQTYGATLLEREYWCERLKEVQRDLLDGSSWDMQFLMSIWMNRGKGICPNVNLSSNIGFEIGTHTDAGNVAAEIPVENIFPLRHPSLTTIHRDSDLNYHKTYFEPYNYGLVGLRRLPYRLNKRLKRLLNHEGSWFRKK